jgi:uncharacterized repeat protein (TIGR04076 family)
MNDHEAHPNLPNRTVLNDAERAMLKEFFWWAKECEGIRVSPSGKLLHLISNDDENLYWTMVSDPEPRLIFHEPVRFVVTVEEVNRGCNAGHKVGDRWEFSRLTPEGMCGSAYHTMYPVLHGLMMTSGLYDGPAADGTRVSCPDGGEVTFNIKRNLWTPNEWRKIYE